MSNYRVNSVLSTDNRTGQDPRLFDFGTSSTMGKFRLGNKSRCAAIGCFVRLVLGKSAELISKVTQAKGDFFIHKEDFLQESQVLTKGSEDCKRKGGNA